jgi:aminoglycoside phosphotransferase
MIRDVFPAVEPASPVYGRLQELRDRIGADPRLRPGGGNVVRAELLPRRRSGGGAEIQRFYWSVRRPAPGSPLGFASHTLFDDRRAGIHRVYEFPEEPVLDWLDDPNGPLGSHGPGATVSVLRYIPLRRVTFLLTDATGLPGRVVVKTQRAASLLGAARALVAARRAVRRAGTDAFAVPRPLRLDARRRLLYLEELPGRPLSRMLAEIGDAEAMSRLGGIHRGLHELDVAGVPAYGWDHWLAAAAKATTRVALLLPSHAPRLESLHEHLRHTAPSDGELAFCQGDFVPSQILCDPTGWSVLDLDDGHLADPHAEVAALLTALARELSVKDERRADALRAAYLDAYVRRAGRPLDPARLRWFLAVARLSQLAHRVVKGRALPGETEAVLDGIAGPLDAGQMIMPTRRT